MLSSSLTVVGSRSGDADGDLLVLLSNAVELGDAGIDFGPGLNGTGPAGVGTLVVSSLADGSPPSGGVGDIVNNASDGGSPPNEGDVGIVGSAVLGMDGVMVGIGSEGMLGSDPDGGVNGNIIVIGSDWDGALLPEAELGGNGLGVSLPGDDDGAEVTGDGPLASSSLFQLGS